MPVARRLAAGTTTAVCGRGRPAIARGAGFAVFPDRSTHRLALRRRHDDRPQIVRPIAGLRHGLRHTRIHRSRGEEGQETKRSHGCLQISLERYSTTLILQYVLPTARKMTGNKILTLYGSTAKQHSVSAVAVAFCPRPRRQIQQLLLRHRSTPPDAFARDHDRQQVSWLAGHRFGPPSQRPVRPQWHSMVVSYPPTVAGAAAELCTRVHVPHSLG